VGGDFRKWVQLKGDFKVKPLFNSPISGKRVDEEVLVDLWCVLECLALADGLCWRNETFRLVTVVLEVFSFEFTINR
jgi:hypothetical protein